jgi:TFIIF-interacting CTD phosphatase-like protein
MAPPSWRAAEAPAVILDLDGVLVNASPSPRPYSDFLVTIPSLGGPTTLSVYKRAYVDAFLAGLAGFARVFLFTAASEEYAAQMARHLDPLGRYFSGVLTRSDCVQVGPAAWRKEWARCGTDMARTIIVGSDARDFAEHRANGVVVPAFDGDERRARLPGALAQIRRLAAQFA